jgi:hypothetical protein
MLTTDQQPPQQGHGIGLRTNQMAVYDSPARFRVVVAGRRFGKTQLSLLEMIRAAAPPNRRVWYIGPSYDQAKRILWDRLKTMTKPFWEGRPSETDLTVRLNSNSTISLRGADRPDSIRGNGLDFAVMDEFASMQPDVWTKVIRPALADRQGRALFLGTPQGSNHFYDLFLRAQSDPEWAAFQFTTSQGGNVSPDEITSASADLDEESFRQEFEAVFTAAGSNRVYYAFDRALHLQPVKFDPYLPLIWAIDFNVNPMCMLLIQRSSDSAYVLDEIIVKPDANTLRACDAFHQRTRPFNQHKMQVEIFGDASGHALRTSAVYSDWVLIRQFFQQWPNQYVSTFRSGKSNPTVRDRVNCVNSRLKSADENVHLYIDPKCRELIKDLEQVTWALDSVGRTTSEIDKRTRDRTHTSDALGYYIAYAFPLRGSIGPNSSGPLI